MHYYVEHHTSYRTLSLYFQRTIYCLYIHLRHGTVYQQVMGNNYGVMLLTWVCVSAHVLLSVSLCMLYCLYEKFCPCQKSQPNLCPRCYLRSRLRQSSTVWRRQRLLSLRSTLQGSATGPWPPEALCFTLSSPVSLRSIQCISSHSSISNRWDRVTVTTLCAGETLAALCLHMLTFCTTVHTSHCGIVAILCTVVHNEKSSSTHVT